MKLAIFSDLHVHAYKDFSRTLPSGRNSRLQMTLDVFDTLRRQCKVQNIRHVLFGGDLFHKKGVLSVGIYQAVFEELQKYERDQIELVLVVGNHDQATLDGKTHAVKSFGALSRVTVVDEPKRVTFNDASTETNIWCVPYMEDVKEFKQALQGGKGRYTPDILLAHGAINGAVSGPVEYRPPEELEVSDIPTDYGFRFFGHYHRRQKMAERCWYIGSPMQHTRGEAGELEKGYLIYDTETRKFRNVPLGMPEFMTLRTHASAPEEVEAAKGNFVDIEFDPDTYSADEVAEWGRLVLNAEAINPVPILKQKNPVKQRLDVSPAMSPRKLVTKYLDEYLPDELDRDEVLKKAMGYLEGT